MTSRFNTMQEAVTAAAELAATTNEPHMAADGGSHRYPRYTVIKTPAVGDLVSRAFNGDYTPEGEISKISKTLKRIETTTGTVFYRRGQSASWVSNGTWAMVRGHIDERNPHF